MRTAHLVIAPGGWYDGFAWHAAIRFVALRPVNFIQEPSVTQANPSTARLRLGDKSIELPLVIGTENEVGIDIAKLRDSTGAITLDEGFANTGACQSTITFTDGERGILRYRGYPIEQLARHSTFVETAHLIIWGELPNQQQFDEFTALLTRHEPLHKGLHNHFDGFPATAPPMAILSAMINAVSCYHPDVMHMDDESTFQSAAARLLSKVRTIAAASYKASIGRPIMQPNPNFDYCRNFLHMLFSTPHQIYEADDDTVRALDLVLLLHADHEQNCSTSTVRMVASSGANLFASCAAGVCALWGLGHGGVNLAVLDMLEEIHRDKIDVREYLKRFRGNRKLRLMGFGHRIYKNFDPRVKILRDTAEALLAKRGTSDPLFDIARRVEDAASKDSYFKDRQLYPNVDFYSGIILRAVGIPTNMLAVMFAIGRMPGYIAQWKEVRDNPNTRIARPRQIYQGPTTRNYTPLTAR